MAIEIKQSLKLAQQLVVTPQLQQAIKLLQMSRLELTELVQKELVENPLLEETEADADQVEEKSTGEKHEAAKDEDKGHEHASDEVGDVKDGIDKEPKDFNWEDYINLYNSSEIREAKIRPEERPSYENFITRTEGLHEHLLWQLKLNEFSEEEGNIGNELIGNVNDEGYLTISVDELATKLSKDVSLIENVLKRIQEFDPVGVASRTLEECLLLQAKQITHDTKLLETIISNHLKDLEKQDYEYIAKTLNLPLDKIEELAHTISLLEPKPGRAFSGEQPHYIVPDVYVRKIGEDYIITLNDEGMPRLRVSQFYRRAMMPGSDIKTDTKEYIQERMRAAVWLIRSIHQRQRTLRRVSKSIVKFQREFFDSGHTSLKPLVLREVADDIGMHESTISRVTTNKYMHTPHGILELKFFFNTGVPMSSGGEGVASEVVRQKIKLIVEEEDGHHPLSDQKITSMLKGEGLDIARRTVAKYRESLGIQSSSQRRRRK